jgi:hypothetical protein
VLQIFRQARNGSITRVAPANVTGAAMAIPFYSRENGNL